MKTVTLNGNMMTTKEAAHRYLSWKLNFPEYYGGNLDALWDILSTISEPIEIKLIYSDKLNESLGDYAKSLLRVFTDAVKENGNLHFEILYR